MKEPTAPLTDGSAPPTRGGRSRGGQEGTRGGRARGSERGRGTTRGGRAGSITNGARSRPEKLPAEAVPAAPTGWDQAPKVDGAAGDWDQPAEPTPLDSSWEHVTAAEATPAPESSKASLKPDGTRSWASIFNKPAPAPVAKKASQIPAPELANEDSAPEQAATEEEDMPGLPPPVPIEDAGTEILGTPPTSAIVPSEPALDITPSKDQLTENNLEQIPDVSEPAPVATAASTVASTIDQRAAAGSSTPLHASQQPAEVRPPMGGYATSAYKATGMPGRSASFQRKVVEQQEAVVMPGKHAVDRAAVQFGSMGLNGTPEDLDIDSDREEAETRAQPPQHSPIAPRASLPPASQAQTLTSQPSASEALPTPRQAPGLPPVNQQPSSQTSLPNQGSQQPSQSGYTYDQYGGRYGLQDSSQETQAPVQKAYEPFGQQAQQSQAYSAYPSTSQAQAPSQQAPSQTGAYSSAPSEMSSYYTSQNQRNTYQNYYGSYAQQPQQSHQDSGGSQARVGSAFGTSASEAGPQYATSNAQQSQQRYGQATDAQTSGHSTPNPALPTQQQQPQPGQIHHQGQAQPGQHGAYPYGNPYYASPYYSSYMNQQVNNHPYGPDRPMFDDVRRYDDQYLTHNAQFGYGGSQGGYGRGPFAAGSGKQGMYGQPHQGYNMNPQTGYDHHSSSPANVGGFGQHSAPNRDGSASGSLGSYGRTGSTQPSDSQQQYGSAAGSYGSVPDVFARSQSGYPGQSQNLTPQASQQGSNDDALRGYGDSKGVTGPSPAPGQPGGRPGSAVNTVQNQSGMPPSQGQGQGQGQQGYSGYPSHQMHGQGSQYAASPGLSGHHQSAGQSHQGSGYGAYGAGFSGSYYGGGNNRGGWGGNYAH